MEMKEFREKFGWSRDRRDGVSSAQLAEVLGVHKRTVKRWAKLGTPKLAQIALEQLARQLPRK